jgi:autotransporter-associated beta strand protein
MKSRNNLLIAIVPIILYSSASVHAANLYWDGGTTDIVDEGDGISAGGEGTWDTTILNWDANAPAHVSWNNTANAADRAVFGGATGLVTMGTDIVVGGITLSVASTITNDGFSLTLNNTGTALSGSAAATLSGSGSLIVNAATQTWSNTNGTMTISCPVNTGGNLLTLDTRSNNLDVTGKISGTGGLTVNSNYSQATAPSNSGNPTLSNSNDYTGTTTINGYIYLNSGGLSALGADTSAVVLNSGGFRLNGSGTVTRGISLTGNNGISKISGTTTLTGAISGGGNLDIRGNFAGLTVIGGAGAVVLGGANTFSGTASLGPDGTLRLAHINALQNATLNMNLGDRSRVDLSTNNLAYNIGGLTGSGNLNLGTGGGSGVVTIGNNNASNTYSGALSGSAGLTKAGSGTQTLSGINTYTGDTTVSGGTLVLADNAGLTFVVTDGSANQLATSGSGAVTLSGDFTIDTSAVTVTDGTWTLVDLPPAAYAVAFSSTFTVNGFTPDGDGVTWTLNDSGNLWTFSETNGTLTLGAGSSLSEFEQWATGAPYNLSGADALAGADPDKDGVINLVEFALNGDPTSGSNNGIAVGKVQDVAGTPALTLTIATRSGTTFDTGTGARVATNATQGVNYTVEGGTNLIDWLGNITEVTPAITSGLPDLTGTDYEYHTFKTAGPVNSTAADFMRVKVAD